MSSRQAKFTSRVALFLGFVCLIEAAPNVARADEMPPPWRAGPCTLWTRVPPEVDYLAPLETDEGLWAASAALDGSCGIGIIMRRQDEWTMSMSPVHYLGCESFTALAEGAGWTAATQFSGEGSKIWVRTSGEWEDISEVSAPDISFETKRVLSATGGSRNLFVATDDGGVFHYDVDGRAWRDITPALTGLSRGLWGDLDGLYLRYQFGSSVQMSRFDGEGWTSIPPPESAGFSDVAGLSSEEVYAISASGHTLYRVEGENPVEAPPIPCGGTPIFYSLSAAPGQLVVNLACRGQHIWKREMDDWTLFAALPHATVPGDTLRVSSNGEVYVGGGRGRLFHVLPVGLESLEQSPQPPALVLAGTSVSSLFSGGEPGVAQLVGEQWQLLPGSPSSVRALWQAPEGAVFAAADEGSGIFALWKYDGSQWSRLRGDLAGYTPRGAIYGRSESDFYWSFDRDSLFIPTILHWDGVSWTELTPVPCSIWGVRDVNIAGADVVLAHCYLLPDHPRDRLYEFDGGSWNYVDGSDNQMRLFQGGPVESPVTYLYDWNEWRVRSQAGWAPLSLPSGYSIQYLASADGSTFVASNGSSYAITDGTQPWSVLSEWPIFSVRDLWTDGGFAASTRTFDPTSGSPGQGIVLCDLR
jgi:hypothetical protein